MNYTYAAIISIAIILIILLVRYFLGPNLPAFWTKYISVTNLPVDKSMEWFWVIDMNSITLGVMGNTETNMGRTLTLPAPQFHSDVIRKLRFSPMAITNGIPLVVTMVNNKGRLVREFSINSQNIGEAHQI